MSPSKTVSSSTATLPVPGTCSSTTSCGAQRSSPSTFPQARPRSRGRVSVMRVSNRTVTVSPSTPSTRVVSAQARGGPESGGPESGGPASQPASTAGGGPSHAARSRHSEKSVNERSRDMKTPASSGLEPPARSTASAG
ncbi:MAG: hypothetical protein M5U28_31455 [Sandaracinaceae bacterium]|nr:hypothetical protein [Sandaracinaceae bacterium]